MHTNPFQKCQFAFCWLVYGALQIAASIRRCTFQHLITRLDRNKPPTLDYVQSSLLWLPGTPFLVSYLFKLHILYL